MGEQVRLNPAVQGVDVRVQVDRRVVLAFIPGGVFERHFGVPAVSGWVASYRVHAEAIDEAIRRKSLLFPDAVRIVLFEDDLVPSGA